MSLRAAGIEAFGDDVALLELPEPPPLETGQVLIEVKAAGVGNWEEFVRTGGWDVGRVPPLALGVEAAEEHRHQERGERKRKLSAITPSPIQRCIPVKP